MAGLGSLLGNGGGGLGVVAAAAAALDQANIYTTLFYAALAEAEREGLEIVKLHEYDPYCVIDFVGSFTKIKAGCREIEFAGIKARLQITLKYGLEGGGGRFSAVVGTTPAVRSSAAHCPRIVDI
jgi:hypothetical protein